MWRLEQVEFRLNEFFPVQRANYGFVGAICLMR
jgi:hypothetical protein